MSAQDDNDDASTPLEPLMFQIATRDATVLDPAVKALAEQLLNAAGGDLLLALVDACELVKRLQPATSYGYSRGAHHIKM